MEKLMNIIKKITFNIFNFMHHFAFLSYAAFLRSYKFNQKLLTIVIAAIFIVIVFPNKQIMLIPQLLMIWWIIAILIASFRDRSLTYLMNKTKKILGLTKKDQIVISEFAPAKDNDSQIAIVIMPEHSVINTIYHIIKNLIKRNKSELINQDVAKTIKYVLNFYHNVSKVNHINYQFTVCMPDNQQWQTMLKKQEINIIKKGSPTFIPTKLAYYRYTTTKMPNQQWFDYNISLKNQ